MHEFEGRVQKKNNNGRNKGLMRNHNLHEIRTRRFLMFVAKKKKNQNLRH